MSNEFVLTWVPFILFLILFAVAIIAEILFLSKKGWTTMGKAVAYVLLTDLLSFGIGIAIGIAALVAILMMTFGPTGRGSDASGGMYLLAAGLGVVLPAVILFFVKRIMLAVFKIRAGSSAWLYSLVVTILVIVVVQIPPPAVFFAFGYATSWK